MGLDPTPVTSCLGRLLLLCLLGNHNTVRHTPYARLVIVLGPGGKGLSIDGADADSFASRLLSMSPSGSTSNHRRSQS